MSIAEAAKQIYESDLRSKLEADHRDEFVAIEPESRAHFLGKSFLEAAMAAKNAFPKRKSFVLRIGHEAAFHIGASST
jgi:hypothetical protein